MKRDFISYIHSMEVLASLTRVGNWEKVPLQNSLGRVLAEDIIASENSPSAPTSSLDGYAIKAKDQKLQGLRVLNIDNPAGSDIDIELNDGEAIKTFTGSIMPKGSDTLIPVENVGEVGGRLYIDKPVPIGYGVRPVGEVYKKGDTIIPRGTEIGYIEIGVLASLNITSVRVFQRPRVAILSTGSEILEVGEERTNPAQIRSSNNYTIEAMVRKHGGEPIQLGIVKDDRDSILEALENSITSGAEFIVTTGGVSVGDYDFVTDVVEKLGFKKLFHGVRIKPGQHILLATNGYQILLSLPGFAYSSTVTAILYLLPLIRGYLGQEFQTPTIKAFLKEKLYRRAKNKTEFVACNLQYENGNIFAEFEGKKVGTSAILTNMLNSASLVVLPEQGRDLEIGEVVDVIVV